MADDKDQRLRMDGIGDGPFDPTADGLRALFESDRKPWAREEAVALIRDLYDDGAMEHGELMKLAVDYPELAGM
jgi:hypothetical protein